MSAAKKTAAPQGQSERTETAGTITTKQLREMHALLRDHGIHGDVTVHEYLNTWLAEHDDDQHPIASRSDLHATTAARIVRDLRAADVATAPGGLAKALIAVQKELPWVAKNKKANVPMKGGGSYSYTYADLADVTAAAMPLLTKHGLAFSCCPRATERGYEVVGVLLHESGETREGALPLHGNDPQQIGGALTYHRRYLLGCMLGLVTDDDADGRQAMGAALTQQWDGPTTEALLAQIDHDAARAGVTYEQATEKFRAGRPLDSLDTLDPWHLVDLAAKVKARADEVLAQQQAKVPPSGEAERPGDLDAGDVPAPAGDDPWAKPGAMAP